MDEEKLAIIAESFSTRTSISAVTRRHGLNKNQLFQWRRRFRDGAFEQISDSVEFVPVVSDAGPGDEVEAAIAPPFSGTIAAGAGSAVIEIMIGATTVRVPPAADERVLRRVLAVVRDLS